jgi:hypothetical protein
MRAGVQHKITKTVAAMMLPVVPEVMEKIITGCRANDIDAIRPFCALLPRSRNFIAIPIDLPPPTSATMALEQIAQLNAMMLAGRIDLNSCSLAVANLRTYLVGICGSEFEDKLRKYEELVCSDTFTSPQANGHDTSAEPAELHNGAQYHGVSNGNGAAT